MNQTLTSKLLSLSDKEEWSGYLERLPELMQDIYFTPDYYEIYEKNGDSKAFCFVFEDGDHLALYPFLLNRINDLGYELDDDYYDIQGAYGYNGVLYSSEDPDFIKNFYNEFNKFCKENNIIAEFTRFHPLLENHKFSKYNLDVYYNRQTVYINLTKGYDEIYNTYSHSVRTNLITSKKSNLTVSTFEDIFSYKNDFVQLYRQNMNKVNAEKYLHFEDIYFDYTFKNLSVIQFVVFKDEKPIASSIVLRYGKYLSHHLIGSLSDYLPYRPNELLYDSIIRYGIENDYEMLYLGGGRSTDENDSLLRFKKKFSKTLSSFYIGKKAHNNLVLEKIYEQWETRYRPLVDKYKNTFLKYRYFTSLIILALVQ